MFNLILWFLFVVRSVFGFGVGLFVGVFGLCVVMVLCSYLTCLFYFVLFVLFCCYSYSISRNFLFISGLFISSPLFSISFNNALLVIGSFNSSFLWNYLGCLALSFLFVLSFYHFLHGFLLLLFPYLLGSLFNSPIIWFVVLSLRLISLAGPSIFS